MKDLQDKLEMAELDKDKVKLEFENYKKATQSVGELMERCEENSRLKAELDCAKKVNQLICLNNIILVLKLFQLSY